MENNLETAAYELAVEIFEGKWDHVGADKFPAASCEAVVQELKTRFPGESFDKYKTQLIRALNEAR